MTTDLTIHVRPPFSEEPARPGRVAGDEILTLRRLPLPSAEVRLSHPRPGLFRGHVAPGRYEVEIALGAFQASTGWSVPRWEGEITGETQRLQLFMGRSDWLAHQVGYSLVPFRPSRAIAIVFEKAPPSQSEAETLVTTLINEFNGLTASRLDPDLSGVPIRNARGSILIVAGDPSANDPASIESFVRNSLGRDNALTPPRVGVPVDLRPGRIKVLDRRFILRHRATRRDAQRVVDLVGGQWIRDLPTAKGTIVFALSGSDSAQHLTTLDDLRQDPDVLYVEPDLMCELEDADAPVDALFARGLETVPDARRYLEARNLREDGSPNVTIAVLDSQIPYQASRNRINHPQAPDNQVIDFRDFYDGPDPDDPRGVSHGLKVYGVIGAPYDDEGAEGVCRGASLVMAERPSVDSSSYHEILLWLCGLVDAVKGFKNASAENEYAADVVCCAHSSGLPLTSAFSDAMRRIVDEGRVTTVDGVSAPRGALVVYAAGNASLDVSVANGFADGDVPVAVEI